MIEHSAVVARKFSSQEFEILATHSRLDNAQNDPVASKAPSPVLALQTLFRGSTPEGDQLRATYEHVLVIVKNRVADSLRFHAP